MDSPLRQSSPPSYRSRTDSSLSVHSKSFYSGIRKRSSSPSHYSTLQAERIQQALQPYSTPDFQPTSLVSAGLQWVTPQHSPQPHLFPDHTATESFPQWSAPTPPRSDSGAPSLSVDATKESTVSGNGSTQPFDFGQSTSNADMRYAPLESKLSAGQSLTSNSSLGFLLPSQYGTNLYESESNSKSLVAQVTQNPGSNDRRCRHGPRLPTNATCAIKWTPSVLTDSFIQPFTLPEPTSTSSIQSTI